jgi:hypothetical protein
MHIPWAGEDPPTHAAAKNETQQCTGAAKEQHGGALPCARGRELPSTHYSAEERTGVPVALTPCSRSDSATSRTAAGHPSVSLKGMQAPHCPRLCPVLDPPRCLLGPSHAQACRRTNRQHRQRPIRPAGCQSYLKFVECPACGNVDGSGPCTKQLPWGSMPAGVLAPCLWPRAPAFATGRAHGCMPRYA